MVGQVRQWTYYLPRWRMYAAVILCKWNKSLGRVSCIKLNFKYESSWTRVNLILHQKKLASLVEWSIDTKVLNMCLREHIKFSMATESFSIFIVWRELQINQFCPWGWQVPQLTIWLITLPFRVGCWGTNTRILRSDPSTRKFVDVEHHQTISIWLVNYIWIGQYQNFV